MSGTQVAYRVEVPVQPVPVVLQANTKERDLHIVKLLHAELNRANDGLLRVAMNVVAAEVGPLASRAVVLKATRAYRSMLTVVEQNQVHMKVMTQRGEIRLVLLYLARASGVLPQADSWDMLLDVARRAEQARQVTTPHAD